MNCLHVSNNRTLFFFFARRGTTQRKETSWNLSQSFISECAQSRQSHYFDLTLQTARDGDGGGQHSSLQALHFSCSATWRGCWVLQAPQVLRETSRLGPNVRSAWLEMNLDLGPKSRLHFQMFNASQATQLLSNLSRKTIKWKGHFPSCETKYKSSEDTPGCFSPVWRDWQQQ